jgi:hypothetical protein
MSEVKKSVAAIVDKILTKGMSLMESERAQQLLSTPQAQKALDFGMNALTKAQEASEALKSKLASKLGLVSQKEVEELRSEIARLQAEKAALEAEKAGDKEQA